MDFLPPVQIITRLTPATLPLHLPQTADPPLLRWHAHLESGATHSGRVDSPARVPISPDTDPVTYHWELPLTLPVGEHRLHLCAENDTEIAATRLIVVPAQSFQAPSVVQHQTLWGIQIALYALRSGRNWGIGDFTDLQTLIEQAALQGASFIALNPLHALFPAHPVQAHPLQSSSRYGVSILYLDVEAIPECIETPALQERLHDPLLQARIRALRSAEQVAYDAVKALKFELLEAAYQQFCTLPDDHPRRHTQATFVTQHPPLDLLACFDALAEHFTAQDPAWWDWRRWPTAYQDRHSPEVQAFLTEHADRVNFYRYLHWQGTEQWYAVTVAAKKLAFGLIGEWSPTVHAGGAETWAYPTGYETSSEVTTGASANAVAQTTDTPTADHSANDVTHWKVSAWEDQAYQPLIAFLHRAMTGYAAVVMDSALLMQPVLASLIRLVSVRQRCQVIARSSTADASDASEAACEAADEFPREHFFYQERETDQRFKSPDQYPQAALVALHSVSQPTLTGYWLGLDLELRDRLGLMPSPEQRQQEIAERAADRARLRMALEQQNLLPTDMSVHSVAPSEVSPALLVALHTYLAHSSAWLVALRPDDVWGREQTYLPHSFDTDYPNWRHKLPVALEQWNADERWRAVTVALQHIRPLAMPVTTAATAFVTSIPDATYRFQFHKNFTFADATPLIPYLHALGMSHCYASPYLKARPGSAHGYDVIDHQAINPELGSEQDFEAFCSALKRYGLGQVLDIVPNHMGVMGSDNQWWLDVLENGQASVYAAYFDIDWQPLPDELRGKVLLPVLGDHYGAVLEQGELHVAFEAETGAFHIQYYEHRFPLDPRTYPVLLSHRLEQLRARLTDDSLADKATMTAALWLDYQSVMDAFHDLPDRLCNDVEAYAKRQRNKDIHKRHLAELVQRSADIALFIQENVAIFNGKVGHPDSFDALHQLIQQQAYRLSFWRVAADDINYRRFFDINELAGLRMEQEAVFRDTHARVLKLIADGQVDGLRIDHPDGLYDPLQYFHQLQQAASRALRLPTDLPSAHPATADITRPLYVVVEKILEGYEQLPLEWPVYGTTGYDFTNLVNGLFINRAHRERLDAIYHSFVGHVVDFEELLYASKKLIMQVGLASELNVLAYQLKRIAKQDRHTFDYTLTGLHNALEEIVAYFPVYRTYIQTLAEHGGVTESDRRYIDWAVGVAKKRSTAVDTGIFEFVRSVLLTDIATGKDPEFQKQVLAFAIKFQQYTGPLMAKGLEDTCFYRYYRLVSLNEVGGDPRRFGISVKGFHEAQRTRAQQWPHAMLSSSTHDSKRSEDVRARINVLSEIPDEWERLTQRLARMNQHRKRLVDDEPAPSSNAEYLLYQTLIGAWPLEPMNETTYGTLGERIKHYMLKAVREAKVHSSWVNPNVEYEQALFSFIDALFADPDKNRFLTEFIPFQQRVARFGLLNSLAQTLLKLTCPGMPDIYQGTELWDFSLVDPDNRRPVDYALRQHRLAQLPRRPQPDTVRELFDTIEDGRAKLYLIRQVLQWRRHHAALFRDGDYLPLAVEGTQADYVCAYARQHEKTVMIVVVPRLLVGLLGGFDQWLANPLGELWQDTRVILSNGLANDATMPYQHLLTGATVLPDIQAATVSLSLASVFNDFPVAVLVRGSL